MRYSDYDINESRTLGTCGASSYIGLIILAVVALLAIGVAFMLRSMAQSRQAAQCEANLMRIGEAIQMYTADYRGSLPFEDNDLKDGSRVSSWRDVLPTYLGEGEFEKIGHCPSIEDEVDRMESYRFNSDLQGESQPKSMWRKLDTLTLPEKTALVFDGDVGGSNVSMKGDSKDMSFRHKDNCNVLFADFHVQPCSKSDRSWIIFEEDMEKGLK
jgi:prepilin-type processing-associated H-X9-DG protein